MNVNEPAVVGEASVAEPAGMVDGTCSGPGCGCAQAPLETELAVIAVIDVVLACPVCEALARVHFAQRAEPVRGDSWTDGCLQQDPDPRPPRITRCARCTRFYWLHDAREIGAFDPETGLMGEDAPAPDSWLTAPTVRALTAEECLAALAEGAAPGEDREMELRILAWWRANDRFRTAEGEGGVLDDPAAVGNLERLLILLPGGEDDLALFRAEACRELGRFNEARAELAGICCSDYRFAKAEVLHWIERGDRSVRRLFANPDSLIATLAEETGQWEGEAGEE
jgi:hypothetical protein